jgi:hypothetical protein
MTSLGDSTRLLWCSGRLALAACHDRGLYNGGVCLADPARMLVRGVRRRSRCRCGAAWGSWRRSARDNRCDAWAIPLRWGRL